MRNGSKCESNLQAILNEEVSVTTKGEHAEWGAILQEGTAKALLAGKIDRNWWLTLKPVIAKRDGMATFEKIDKRLRDRPASAIFADAEALLRIESTIKAIMKLLGFTGSDNNSFSKAFKTLIRMAGSIEGIPAGCPSIPGLKKRLMEVGTLLFRCAQDRLESMLVTPATVAKRVKDFILEDGPPLNALLALDETLDRILLDVEHGVGNVQLLGLADAEAVEDEVENLRGIHEVAAGRELAEVDCQHVDAPEARRRALQGPEVLHVNMS
jgi:hypothetical protein